MTIISEIWIYPVKSLPGFKTDKARVEERGLSRDRRWMLVDENGVFITQRKHPELSQMRLEVAESGFEVSATGLGKLFIPWETPVSGLLEVEVWGDRCQATPYSEEADKWFSTFLGMKCRLVFMPDSSERLLEAPYNPGGKVVSFADGYPILIVSQKSLDDLSEKAGQKMDARRFRPNIVLTGLEKAFEEDDWKKVSFGGVELATPKACARCVLTTVDPDTGQKGKEPLQTLSTYRRDGNKILFGQNAYPLVLGEIATGMEALCE